MKELSKANKFLLQVLLGQNVRVDDEYSLAYECIKKAYRDMLTGGRFVKASLSNEQLKLILISIKNNKFIYKRSEIDYIASLLKSDSPIIKYENREATTFGLAQKILNMLYKYFYVVHSLMPEMFNLDYSLCDCPIDSVVLNTINYSVVPWTRLSKDQYLDVQSIIEKKSLQNGCNKLEYDFLAW